MKKNQWKYFAGFLKKHHIEHKRTFKVHDGYMTLDASIEFWVPGKHSWDPSQHVFFSARHPHAERYHNYTPHRSYSTAAFSDGKKTTLRRVYLNLSVQHRIDF